MKLRRLIPALLLALTFVATAPGVALADPISATVAAIAGWVGSLTGVAAFVVNSALYAAGSWAVSKAAQALGLNKNAVQERQASVTTLSLGETPRELVVGEACTGGSLVDAWNWGGKYKTDYVTRCIALADHQVDRLVGYYVDDQYFEYTANGNQSAFNGALRLIFVNATANGSNPPADVGASDGGWTNADKVVGVTHVWVVTKIDDKVWTQGHPRFKFVLRGLKVYDPRFDPALGYVGPIPQTWDDPSTHRFTRNAALLDYAYDRGIYATGRQGQDGHLLIGRGLSAEEAPPERIIAAANLCDEVVGDEPRYTANGVISAAQSFLEVKQAFAAAMAGIIIQPDGGVAIEPGQAKAVVATITDGDLVGGEAKTFSEFLPDTDGGRVNTVVPRYVEPSQGYKDHSGAVRRDLADLAADGGPRELTLPLLLVTSARQADWCAEITRLKARLERRATIVLPPDYAEIEEGDWIAWQSARHHGGATVRYRVTSWSLGEDWRQHLTLEEIASSVYGVPDPAPDVTNPPPPPVPVDALQLFGPRAEAITLAGELTALPAVRFTWGRTFDEEGEVDDAEAPDAALVQIRAEIRRAGSTDVASALTDDIYADAWVVTNGVVPDATLECRLTPIAASPTRPVLPSEWMTVSTSSVVADVDPDVLINLPAFQDLYDNALALMELLLQSANDRVTGALEDRDTWRELIRDLMIRQGLIAETDPVSGAAILRGDITLQGKDGVTLAQTLTLLYAADANAEAMVALEQLARISGDEAEAAARLTAIAAQEDALASAQLSLRSYTDGKVATAVAGLATTVALNNAISSATLSLQSYADAAVAAGKVGLATVSQLNAAQAAAAIDAQSRVDAYAATAALNFVAVATYNALSSLVGIQGTAISGLQEQNNLARLELFAAAGGGRPARFALVSGSGAEAALIADRIWFGENTTFEDATDTLRTVTGSVCRITAWGAPFGPDSLIFWEGPSGVTTTAATKANAEAAGGQWKDSTGDSWFGGKTLSSPFEAAGGGPIAVTGWTTVASTTARRLVPGKVSMAARWRATLSPADPPSEAPSYGLSWRLVSTDPSGGDVRPVVSGYVDGAANLANIVMGVDRAQGLITTNGQRVLRLQLALSGSDDTTAASARDAQLVGDYLAGATLAPF